METIEQLNKAVKLAETQAMVLLKSTHDNHVAYTRTSASGTVSNIQAKGAPTVTTSKVSGTKAGWTHDLSEGGTLQRDVEIKGQKYPKGSTVRVLPGGTFIHHNGVKHNPSVGSQWHDKYGQGVQRTEENLGKLAEGLAGE